MFGCAQYSKTLILLTVNLLLPFLLPVPLIKFAQPHLITHMQCQLHY